MIHVLQELKKAGFETAYNFTISANFMDYKSVVSSWTLEKNTEKLFELSAYRFSDQTFSAFSDEEADAVFQQIDAVFSLVVDASSDAETEDLSVLDSGKVLMQLPEIDVDSNGTVRTLLGTPAAYDRLVSRLTALRADFLSSPESCVRFSEVGTIVFDFFRDSQLPVEMWQRFYADDAVVQQLVQLDTAALQKLGETARRLQEICKNEISPGLWKEFLCTHAIHRAIDTKLIQSAEDLQLLLKTSATTQRQEQRRAL